MTPAHRRYLCRHGLPRFFAAALMTFAALVLSGCDQQGSYDRLIPKEEIALTKGYVAKIKAHDYAGVVETSDPSLLPLFSQDKFDQLALALPNEEPKSVRVVGANTTIRNATTAYELTLEYEYLDSWFLVAASLERRDGKILLQGISVTPRGQSMEAENRFSFDGKGLTHYVVLFLVAGIPLLIFCTLVICVRTKIAKRKWLWLLFIAVGLMQFQFNWSTGAWELQPVSLVLPGTGFYRVGPFAPWIFTLTLPVGAIVFLLRRNALRQRTDEARQIAGE